VVEGPPKDAEYATGSRTMAIARKAKGRVTCWVEVILRTIDYATACGLIGGLTSRLGWCFCRTILIHRHLLLVSSGWYIQLTSSFFSLNSLPPPHQPLQVHNLNASYPSREANPKLYTTNASSPTSITKEMKENANYTPRTKQPLMPLPSFSKRPIESTIHAAKSTRS